MSEELVHYDFGEAWAVTASFALPDGTPTDPDDVTATLHKPDGTLVEYTLGANLVAVGAGVFTVTDVADLVDVHYLEVVGVGAAGGRNRFSFVVDPRWPGDLLRPYALTTIEACELMIDRVGTEGGRAYEEDDNRWLAELINAYSRLAADCMQRELLPLSDDTLPDVARVFLYDGCVTLSLAPYEARSISGVTMDSNRPDYLRGYLAGELTEGFTLTGTSFYTRNATPEGTFLELQLPERSRETEVTVTGKWGAGVVPTTVKLVVEAEVADAYWASRTREPGVPASEYLPDALSKRSEDILFVHANHSPVC